MEPEEEALNFCTLTDLREDRVSCADSALWEVIFTQSCFFVDMSEYSPCARTASWTIFYHWK